jgi:hypothetical protein
MKLTAITAVAGNAVYFSISITGTFVESLYACVEDLLKVEIISFSDTFLQFFSCVSAWSLNFCSVVHHK